MITESQIREVLDETSVDADWAEWTILDGLVVPLQFADDIVLVRAPDDGDFNEMSDVEANSLMNLFFDVAMGNQPFNPDYVLSMSEAKEMGFRMRATWNLSEGFVLGGTAIVYCGDLSTFFVRAPKGKNFMDMTEDMISEYLQELIAEHLKEMAE